MEFRQRLPGTFGTCLKYCFKALILWCLCLEGLPATAQEFQLAPPQAGIGYSYVPKDGAAADTVSAYRGPEVPRSPGDLSPGPIFRNSTLVSLWFDLAGAEIRYTLDGSLPDAGSPLYLEPFNIDKSCVLTAVTMHPAHRTSDPMTLRFIQFFPEYEPFDAALADMPSPPYVARGVTSLLDLGKGHAELNDRWLGFEGKDLDLTLKLNRKERPGALVVSTLSATGSWILPPRRIEVWASRYKKRGFKKVGALDCTALNVPVNVHEEKIYTLPLKKHRAQYWRVLVRNYGPLPDWHPGKGKPAWLFVDEILLQR